MNKNIYKDVFTSDEILNIKDTLNFIINRSSIIEFEDQVIFDPKPNERYVYLNQGRKDLFFIEFDKNINDKVTQIAHDYSGNKDLSLVAIQYTEYVGNLKGNPSLGMHYDGGGCDFILDYQLNGNISWGLGVEEDVYTINSNELLVLHPASRIHYRPKKRFLEEDFLQMLFFKFFEKSEPNPVKVEIDSDRMNKIEYVYNNYYSMDGE